MPAITGGSRLRGNRFLPLTIAQNVAAQDQDDFDREKVQKCLKAAGLWEKIQTFPKREDSPVKVGVLDEGVDLSGGERQTYGFVED